MGLYPQLAQLPYEDPKFKKHRKVAQEFFSAHTVPSYRALQELETAILIQEMIDAPKDFRIAIRRYIIFAASTSTIS